MRAAVGRVSEAVVPRRLGTGFRWLLASSRVSNIGDGCSAGSALTLAFFWRPLAAVAHADSEPVSGG